VETIRNVGLARYTGCRLHVCHVSTGYSLGEIIRAKKEGAQVTCEVTPHHIALTDETEYRVNPPLRKESDVDAIIKAIKEGWVDAIATDHAPHTPEDKASGSPGMVGLETAFPVCYTELVKKGHISLGTLVQLMSEKPSEMLGINKGTLDTGKNGDLVLVDLDKEITIDSRSFASKGKNTPFDGRKYYGEIISTIRHGKVVYMKEECSL
jgi:dihydroorotase